MAAEVPLTLTDAAAMSGQTMFHLVGVEIDYMPYSKAFQGLATNPGEVGKQAALNLATFGTKSIYDALDYYYETGDAEGASEMLGGAAAGVGLTAYGLRGTKLGTTPISQLPRALLQNPSKLFGSNEYAVADAAKAAKVRQALEAYYKENAPPGASIKWVDNVPGGRNGLINTQTGEILLSNELRTQFPHLAEGTLVEELQHFHQLQARGWLGRNVTGAEEALLEQEVVQRMQRSGFKIFDTRKR
jgi:hypothetical protein